MPSFLQPTSRTFFERGTDPSDPIVPGAIPNSVPYYNAAGELVPSAALISARLMSYTTAGPTTYDWMRIAGTPLAVGFMQNPAGAGVSPIEAMHISRGAGHSFFRSDAYRVGSTFYNSGITFSGPRADSADNNFAANRAAIVLPGNSVDNNSQMFILVAPANGNITGDAGALRTVNSIEYNGSRIAMWRPTNGECVRIDAGTNTTSWIGTDNSKLGIGISGALTANLNVGKSAATARIYNQWTDGSNNEFAYMGGWNANVSWFGSGAMGTGTVRDAALVRGGVEKIKLTAAGITMPGLPTTNPGAGSGVLWNNAGVLTVA